MMPSIRAYVLIAIGAATLAGAGGYLLGQASRAEVNTAESDAPRQLQQLLPAERFVAREKGMEASARAAGKSDEITRRQPTDPAEHARVSTEVAEQKKQRSARAEGPGLSVIEKERDACVRELDKHRELAGTPIEPQKDVPARMGQTALAQAYNTAFAQTGVPGKLDSIDCSEYPCIVFSSIRGDEEVAEKVEHAKVLRAYDDDVGTMLMWAITDETAERNPSQPKPPERTLAAVAWVTRGQHEALGQNLDRRIRMRVAEYWNATRPSEHQ